MSGTYALDETHHYMLCLKIRASDHKMWGLILLFEYRGVPAVSQKPLQLRVFVYHVLVFAQIGQRVARLRLHEQMDSLYLA